MQDPAIITTSDQAAEVFGLDAIADAVGVSRKTVRNKRREGFPAWWWAGLSDLAASRQRQIARSVCRFDRSVGPSGGVQ